MMRPVTRHTSSRFMGALATPTNVPAGMTVPSESNQSFLALRNIWTGVGVWIWDHLCLNPDLPYPRLCSLCDSLRKLSILRKCFMAEYVHPWADITLSASSRIPLRYLGCVARSYKACVHACMGRANVSPNKSSGEMTTHRSGSVDGSKIDGKNTEDNIVDGPMLSRGIFEQPIDQICRRYTRSIIQLPLVLGQLLLNHSS